MTPDSRLFGGNPDTAYHRRRLDALEGRHPLVADDGEPAVDERHLTGTATARSLR
jgi:hypothetical protein